MLNVLPPHPTGDAAPHAAAVWLDLVNPDANEIRLVEDMTGLRLPSREELTSIEQSSRLSRDDRLLRMATPVVADAEKDHPQMSHVGVILTPKLLVTVRFAKLFVFEKAAEKCVASEATTSVAIFATLMEAIVARQADLLEDARNQLDQISHRVFRNATQDPRRAMRNNALMRDKMQRLGRIAELTSIVRDSLLGVDRMVDYAGDNAEHWFSPEQHKRLHQVVEDIGVLTHFEEHLLGKVQFLLDAVLGFINIEQNDIFKVLTIASVVGIFPTLVAGWYGMNFQNMPELHWTYGYPFGIGLILASTILPLAWFKWRGWM
ncbi:MAG TPA: magnesium transporter CorA family protein [Caulobacteraceae bacterium]|jgi:magnesium transporter|nr:magnesium transporter CorA family protein [Caulobacteraceae bacterium]